MYRLKRVSAEAKKSGVSPLFLWAIASGRKISRRRPIPRRLSEFVLMDLQC
ncbi:hypothetical protein D3C71_811910 [compost metagenome]